MHFCTFATRKTIMLGIPYDSKRNFGLDLLRAVAIFFVVHGHGVHLLASSRLSFLQSVSLPHGVDIFFILSGYLIGYSFLSYANKNNGVDLRKTLLFYGRTALRILPNYYFILVVYYLLVQGGIIHGNTHEFSIWYFITFTQNLFTPFYNFYWESWSLPVQWWFYILFPLSLTVFTKRFNAKRATLFICFFFIAFTLMYRYSISDHLTDRFWRDVWLRKTVASRCDNIYIGVLAAWVRTYMPDFWQRHSVKSFVVGIFLMVASILIPRPFGSIYSNVFALTIPPVAIALWLPLLTRIKSFKTIIGSIVARIGILSYAMFLTNLMVCQIIDVNFADFFSRLGAWGYLIYWAIVLCVSYILFMAIENPFIIIRSRLQKEKASS